MPSNNTLHERMAEAGANAEAAMIVKVLADYAMEPSTKRFVRSRAARIERWQQLLELATRQTSALAGLERQPARRKPQVVAKVAVATEPAAPPTAVTN